MAYWGKFNFNVVLYDVKIKFLLYYRKQPNYASSAFVLQ